jgi:acyl-CoA oxidase
MKQIKRFVEVRKTLKDPDMIYAFTLGLVRYSESFSMRIFVHDGLFRQAIKLFGTVEQWEAWKDDVENWNVIGCFAMVS